MVKLKHSKLKNTGFIYEILVRSISIDILQNKIDTPSYTILKKFFKHGTQLNQQLLLYNILLNNKMNKQQHAQMLIQQTLTLHDKLNKNILNKQKYKLIQQIKQYYNIQDLFSTKVQSYKALASIYKLFQTRSSNELYSPIDVVNSKTAIIQHIINNQTLIQQKDQIVQNFINQDADTQTLAYKLIIQRFNTKYKMVFTQQQKQLLRKYMHSFSNIGILKQYVQKIIPIIIDNLQQKIKTVDDNVIKIKLQQVLNQISNIPNIRLIKQSHIVALLKTYSLIQQLKEVK